ncbi:CASP-like protein 1U2 [Triticum dicoccoides]|uniref:CASP-like protein 1U2 n=1 Tax=Triticum dicoccoides TaxID=85692 RepID=UPI00188FFF88|nr:CASP-like protein 1U2 [Triticum dicoccoides]
MSGCWERDEPNGSKAVSLLLRLSALILALASAVMMATADNCTVAGATPTAVNYRDYGAFVYLVWANVAAAVLEAAAVYLQLSGAGDDDGDDRGSQVPGVVLVVVDVLAQALLYSSTGAAYGCGKVGVDVCLAFGQQVGRSKLLSFGASVSLGLAAVVKDVSLPFNVWPG